MLFNEQTYPQRTDKGKEKENMNPYIKPCGKWGNYLYKQSAPGKSVQIAVQGWYSTQKISMGKEIFHHGCML